ncbi:hypothetical protein DACRYDRAFT_24888 [Dacryopinax primogenitus]|uniref:Anaphase-promoting complex subunit 5 domain-containing protein n=1 Tax=Dacryopinax primogenitus (strain DJM 731) TaxID=1858805 RepID=M5FWZ1_DACPD|nr:uncharacterized protein DACRYDRAFT_24888 [Dacryopinax primogenitus]EJT97981.1 hypothetical protein DACRYDRAFT_24888 [Dacryopinax primogenitus]
MTLCLDQLGIVLTTVGELEEAYQASNEAVQLRRVLINANPKAYSSQLAWSLGNLSEALARGGDIPNALMAIEEAVQLYKPLVEKDPRFTENLAWGLGTLSKRLAQVPGEHLGAKKALEAIQEAVELYRPLVSHHIEVYGQNLAWALGTLSQRLAETKRYSDALPAAQESVALLRDIADCKPETAITPDLALQLRNLASRYSDAGCSAEALETIEEAIKLYRLQCLRLPRRYNPELMRALHMKCTFLEVAGRRKEAPAPLRESIALLRDLEKRQPALYRTTLESYLQRLQELTVTVGSDDGETEETEAEHSHVEGE